jgi:hypothetical protein
MPNGSRKRSTSCELLGRVTFNPPLEAYFKTNVTGTPTP